MPSLKDAIPETETVAKIVFKKYRNIVSHFGWNRN